MFMSSLSSVHFILLGNPVPWCHHAAHVIVWSVWWRKKQVSQQKATYLKCLFSYVKLILNKYFQLLFVAGCYGVPILSFLCCVSILLPADSTNSGQVWWHWSKDHVQVLSLEILSHFIHRFYHWKGWDCVVKYHNIYLHSSIFQNSTISLWLSGSDHQRAVNLNSLIKYNGKKKIDFSSFCLNYKEDNFSGLLPSAYSLDKLLVNEGTHLSP